MGNPYLRGKPNNVMGKTYLRSSRPGFKLATEQRPRTNTKTAVGRNKREKSRVLTGAGWRLVVVVVVAAVVAAAAVVVAVVVVVIIIIIMVEE